MEFWFCWGCTPQPTNLKILRIFYKKDFEQNSPSSILVLHKPNPLGFESNRPGGGTVSSELAQREALASHEQSLWEQFQANPCLELRNQLVVQYRHLAFEIAQKMAKRLPPQVELDDIEMFAICGLIHAIENYDASRGVPFAVYCRRRIEGSILDELRNLDWMPRQFRSQVSKEELPTIRNLFSLSEAKQDELIEIEDTQIRPAIEDLEEEELYLEMRHQMSELERQIVELRYFQGLSNLQIGQRLSISEFHVCKTHAALVIRLRRIFAGQGAAF